MKKVFARIRNEIRENKWNDTFTEKRGNFKLKQDLLKNIKIGDKIYFSEKMVMKKIDDSEDYFFQEFIDVPLTINSIDKESETIYFSEFKNTPGFNPVKHIMYVGDFINTPIKIFKNKSIQKSVFVIDEIFSKKNNDLVYTHDKKSLREFETKEALLNYLNLMLNPNFKKDNKALPISYFEEKYNLYSREKIKD